MPPDALPSDGRAAFDPLFGRACTEGAVEDCSLTLARHEGVLSCYEGTRVCQNGRFGACENGHAFTLNQGTASPVPASGASASLRPLSFSDPSECTDNPCNRYCREFNEAPPAGLVADEDGSALPLSSWSTGNLSEFPPEWVSLGVQEPCQVAGDCQFNSACVDPALGSCGHSVCATGEPLVDGCNRCADAVCAVNADCCGAPTFCAHDPCEGSGPPLDPSCDACVAAVCAVHPDCCGVSWNADCVGYVATECAPLGQSCGCPEGSIDVDGTCLLGGDQPRDWGLAADACAVIGSGWTLAQVDNAAENAAAQSLLNNAGWPSAWLGGRATDVDQWTWQRSGEVFFLNDASGGSLQNGYTFENWAAAEPQLGVVGRGIAMNPNGEWRDDALDAAIDFLCEGPPSRLTPRTAAFRWGPECVDLALSECGVQCPDTTPQSLGACIERRPTQLEASCASFDVAIAAPCEEDGKPLVPVCNHGQVEAPASLRLRYLPASEFGRALPDLSAAGDCTLGEPIPPGRCVLATDCPGLTPDSALVINAGGADQDPSECRTDDNWAIYQAAACGAPICEASVHGMPQVAANDCSVALQNPLALDTAAARATLQRSIPERHCAPGEVLWGASCYFFSNSDIDTWDDAEDHCRARGAGWSLVALNSAAENDWVRSQTNPLDDVQIGFNDKVTEGDHVWSNGSCRKYTNWDTGRPNNDPPGSQQCVRITAASGARWNDKDCNSGAYPYVCEGPVADAQGGCSSGELAGPDGRCYAFDPAEASWAEASDACRARGPGWDLARIEDESTNDFVTGLINCTPTWVADVSSALSGGVVFAGNPYMDELGGWQDSLDGTPRASLCQGPSVPAASVPLSRVDDASLCTGGDEFYFEGTTVAPEALTLCPATCEAGNAVPGTRLDVEIPCGPPTPPALETLVEDLYYTADCADGGAIWDFFYYDAVTPADSRIEFAVRTAPSIAELESTSFTQIAEAHAIPEDTQRCEINPLKNCPVDIYTQLGAPAHQYEVLELAVRLIPGTSGEGPLLRDWRVRFSCPPAQ